MISFPKLLTSFIFFFICTTALSQESLLKEIDTNYLRRLVDTAKAYYPKVKTFNHSLTIAEENVKKAKSSWFDLITFSYSYSPSNTTTIVSPTLSGSQVGVYFNLGNLLLKPHNIKQAKEELEIVALNKKEYDLNIEAEVKNRYYRYLQQQSVLVLQRDAAIDLETLLKDVKYKYEKGEETLENYSKAIVELNKQKQSILAAESFLLIAKNTLEEIICKKLEAIH